jgi:predicted Fe-Mo cluster-binding NifX family protein
LSTKKLNHSRRIAVPSMGDSPDSPISRNLGRSPFIIIYDDEAKEYSFYENIGFRVQDGSGLKAAETIIQNNAGVLLTREIGRKAYSVLVKQHVIVHLIDSGGTVKSAVSRFIKGE